uniref:Transcription factor 21 n=1 Tax=Cyprinus carpio TaxID=7962 RepID=A0A8C1D3R7_CYPCA
MSTGSISDVDEFHESELLDSLLKFGSVKDPGTSNESTEDSSNCEGASVTECTGKRRKSAAMRKSAPNGIAQEGKQVQRNAANARERARMRVLSKAFSRLKTTLPWVPPDTKLSKLDTLRLASSYIAHLRQILANDKYENGYIHPVNLISGERTCHPVTLPARDNVINSLNRKKRLNICKVQMEMEASTEL